MPSASNSDCVPTGSRNRSRPEFKLLLDQGFPKPPGFAVNAVDKTVKVVHLHDFDRALAEQPTPDWMLYLLAAEGGFNALVTRDKSQLEQLVEMYTLSRLQGFAVITWRRSIEDPVREWGQLLAYLPEVKKLLRSLKGGRSILLPDPTLSERNIYNPEDRLGTEATRRGISNREARLEAEGEIKQWLTMIGDDPHRFDRLLRLRAPLNRKSRVKPPS